LFGLLKLKWSVVPCVKYDKQNEQQTEGPHYAEVCGNRQNRLHCNSDFTE